VQAFHSNYQESISLESDQDRSLPRQWGLWSVASGEDNFTKASSNPRWRVAFQPTTVSRSVICVARPGTARTAISNVDSCTYPSTNGSFVLSGEGFLCKQSRKYLAINRSGSKFASSVGECSCQNLTVVQRSTSSLWAFSRCWYCSDKSFSTGTMDGTRLLH
jgi:hypothetical protein